MVNELRTIKVTILGKNYTLSTDDDERNVIKAVQFVDSELKNIAFNNKNIDNYTAAVLLALDLAGQLEKQKQSLNQVEKKAFDLNSLIDLKSI